MVDTGCVSGPDVAPVALRPSTGMLTVNATGLRGYPETLLGKKVDLLDS